MSSIPAERGERAQSSFPLYQYRRKPFQCRFTGAPVVGTTWASPVFESCSPSVDLRGIVQCYWRMKNHHARSFWILPQAQTEIIVIDSELSLVCLDGITRLLPHCFVGMCVNHPITFKASGPFVAAGIRLLPCAFSFSALASDEVILPNRIAKLRFPDPFLDTLDLPLLRHLGFPEMARRLEEWLRNVFPTPLRMWNKQALTSKSVVGLSKSVRFHIRWVQREFQKRMHLEPRQCLRLIRFQEALRLLTTERMSLTDVALGAGYADQAHFCHDVKRLTNRTPTELVEGLDPIASCFGRLGPS